MSRRAAFRAGLVLLGGWSFAFFYHLANGIRHLFWDMGIGFEIHTVTRSGIAVVLLSLLMTGGTWYYILKGWEYL